MYIFDLIKQTNGINFTFENHTVEFGILRKYELGF